MAIREAAERWETRALASDPRLPWDLAFAVVLYPLTCLTTIVAVVRIWARQATIQGNLDMLTLGAAVASVCLVLITMAWSEHRVRAVIVLAVTLASLSAALILLLDWSAPIDARLLGAPATVSVTVLSAVGLRTSLADWLNFVALGSLLFAAAMVAWKEDPGQ